jgi:molybdate transport system regulatory protein
MSVAGQLELSTRNQLSGRVAGVVNGAVMAEVVVEVAGMDFVAAITRHSSERLALQSGDTVSVLIKATEVTVAKGSEPIERLSTRNQIPGTLQRIETGAVMAELTIATAGGEIVAAVTQASVARLALEAGDDVVALVKATEVMLAK